jgi:hypothetical protein
MTLQEYINYANGKQIEAGGSANAKFQCVDLANDYMEKVLGLPKILWTDAKDFIKKGVASGNYDRVTTPEPGDIAVWQWAPYGHIAIYIGNGKYLTQNYPTALKTVIASLPKGEYMRKKGLTMSQMDDIMKQFRWIDEQIARLDKKSDDNFNALKAEYSQWNADRQNEIRDLYEKVGAVQPSTLSPEDQESVSWLTRVLKAIFNK